MSKLPCGPTNMLCISKSIFIDICERWPVIYIVHQIQSNNVTKYQHSIELATSINIHYCITSSLWNDCLVVYMAIEDGIQRAKFFFPSKDSLTHSHKVQTMRQARRLQLILHLLRYHRLCLWLCSFQFIV